MASGGPLRQDTLVAAASWPAWVSWDRTQAMSEHAELCGPATGRAAGRDSAGHNCSTSPGRRRSWTWAGPWSPGTSTQGVTVRSVQAVVAITALALPQWHSYDVTSGSCESQGKASAFA